MKKGRHSDVYKRQLINNLGTDISKPNIEPVFLLCSKTEANFWVTFCLVFDSEEITLSACQIEPARNIETKISYSLLKLKYHIFVSRLLGGNSNQSTPREWASGSDVVEQKDPT